MAEDLLSVLESFFYFVQDILLGGLVNRLRLYDITPVSQVVKHNSHSSRRAVVSLLSVPIIQPNNLYIAINNREKAVTVHTIELFFLLRQFTLSVKHVFTHVLRSLRDTSFEAHELLALSIKLFGIFWIEMLSDILLDQE